MAHKKKKKKVKIKRNQSTIPHYKKKTKMAKLFVGHCRCRCGEQHRLELNAFDMKAFLRHREHHMAVTCSCGITMFKSYKDNVRGIRC